MTVFIRWTLVTAFLLGSWAGPAQEKTPPPAKATPTKTADSADYSQEALVIEKLQTTARFNEDGTGSREVLLRARVQTEAGVQQLGQLALGYNSSSEKLDVDYVRVHKPDGSVVEPGPDSVQDLSAPVEREAPVYTDYRQKHVTVPGLRPGDTFEYKITTKIHTPLAPGHFWLEYDFSEQVIMLEETLTVVVPAGRTVKMKVRPEFKTVQAAAGKTVIYTWRSQHLKREEPDEEEKPRRPRRKQPEVPAVQISTFQSWEAMGQWYAALEKDRVTPNEAIVAKAAELTKDEPTDLEKVQALYDFVAKNFRYVSLSFGLGRYQPHAAAEVLANQYGDCKDKHTLLASLLAASGFEAYPVLINSRRKIDPDVPSPSQFDHVITAVHSAQELLWMDTTTEVAPFRMLSFNLRKKQALLAPRPGASDGAPRLVETPADPPFASTQRVEIEGTVSELGKLDASVHYTMRGDGELPLRLAFRRTPQNQWKQLAQMISSGDGVGGVVQDIKGSDPADTTQPFTLELRLSQANFLDWAKKRAQVSIPVPNMGLPPVAAEDPAPDDDPLDLGTPVDVTMKLKLTFPQKFQLRAPVPVALTRDYAEYRSRYTVEGQGFSLERTLRFKLREVPAARTRDYLAFSRAVRSDEVQSIGVENPTAGTAAIPESAKPEELYTAAMSALRSENPALAIDLLKRTLQLDPKYKQIWNTLGFAYFSAQSFDDAAAAFQKQIAADPYDENAYRNLGLVYQRQQKYAESVEALKKQLEIKPIDRAAQAMLGIVYREWRKYDEAAAALEKAITLDPESAALHVNLGQSYLNLEQNEKALAAFDRAVELEPSPAVWNNVAYELSVHKVHLDRALQYAETAVATTTAELRNVELARVSMNDMRKVSALASYWDTLGWIHFQNGNLEKAEKYCKASWLLDFHGEVGDHLGQIAEKQGDRAAALHYYWQAQSGTRPVPESDSHAAALAADKSLVEQANKLDQGRRSAQDMRTVTLGPVLKETANAEFLLLFEPGPQGAGQITSMRFVKGSEKLRGLEGVVRAQKFAVFFPEETPAKIARRGVFSCSVVSGTGCIFVLLPADGVTSLD